MAELTEEELALFRAMLEEWQARKQQEARDAIRRIDREIEQPLPDIDPRAQRQARLATEEGQLKALLPHLPDEERRLAQEAITRSEQARAELGKMQPIGR